MRLGQRGKIVLALALAGASAAVGAQAQQGAAPAPSDMQKILENCDAHKFETVVTTTSDGAVHTSNVRLCGAQGQSDEAWLHTLKDAADKTAASTELPPEVKQQIVAALNTEIARLTALLPPPRAALRAAPGLPPPPARTAPTEDFARSYSVFAPLPDRPQTAPTIIAAPGTARGPAAVVAPAPPPIGISIHCTTARDFPAAEPCDTVDRGTLLLVRADQAVAAPFTLRFVRRGDARGEVRLAPMQRGAAARVAVPADVCAGVFRSKLEIQVVGPAGQSFGPYELRC